MDSKLQKILEKNLPDFVDQVNPQQLLIYLPCLSRYSKEEIETAQNSKSRSYAAQVLHSNLVRRPEGFWQLLAALRHDSVGCTALADRLDPNQEHSVGYNGGGQDYRRQNGIQSDHASNNSPPVSPGAAGWQAGSPGAFHMQTMSANSRSSPKYNLNTPWEKLPGRVKTILKKFDAQKSFKKIEDLADLLGFNIGEINEVRADVPQGESLTLAFLERWMQMQSKPVTLGDIMKIFYDLEMEYILQELEQKTDVKFDRRDERDASPQAVLFPQGGAGPSAEERNKVDSHNINKPFEKISGTDKMVSVVGANRQIPSNVCTDNTLSSQGIRQTFLETGNRNDLHMSQNDSEIVLIVDDSTIEVEDKRNNVDKFKGYREEDIVRNSGDDLHTQGNHFQQGGRSESYKTISETVARELSRELQSVQMNDGSGGFPVHQTIPNGDDIIQEKNNLDRSVSSSSSNTENSTYDSMPDTSYVNDLNSEDIKKSVNHQPINSINADDESRNEENSEVIKDTEKTEVTEGKSREAGIIQNSMVGKREGYERMSEIPVADNSVNHLLHTNSEESYGSPQMVDDEDALKADLSQMVFEEKMMATGQNFSNIISQSDPPESREASLSVTNISASCFSPIKTEMKMPKTGTVFNSIEHYVDYSLEDDRQAAPEHTNYSKELNSIEKKAAKTLPGHEIPDRSADIEIDGYHENPSGSFQIDWQLSADAEAVSAGVKNPVFVNQLSDQQLDHNQTHADNGVSNTADEEMEFTRRGPDNQNMPEKLSKLVPKCEEAGDNVKRNVSSEETVTGNVACLEPVTRNVAANFESRAVSFKNERGEKLTVNNESLQSNLTEEAENEVSDAVIYRNNLCSNSVEDLKQFSILDSFKTICSVVKVVYDSAL